MRRKITLFLLFMFINHSFLYGAFKDIGWSVRAMGMGGAFIAVSDDSSSMLINPAGIRKIKNIETTYMYTKPFVGLDDLNFYYNYLSYVQPTRKFGNFGISWAYIDTNSIYKENIYTISYAQNFNKIFSAGVNLKYLEHSYTMDSYTVNDPVFEKETKKENITFDMGIILGEIWDKSNSLSFGASINNITQPDVGLKQKDIVPLDMGIGFAYYLKGTGFIKDITYALDVRYRDQEWGKLENKLSFSLGSEIWIINKIIGLRAGGNTKELSLGVSFQKQFTIGFGLRFDYGFNFPFYIEESAGTHRGALSFRF